MPKSSPSETPARNNKKPYRCPSAAIPFPHASPRLQGLPPPPSIADALAREDLPPYRLLELEKELKVHNVQQELVTYDTDMGKWVTWARPVIEYKNGTQKVAATSGWSSIKDFKPPSCPHSANPFRTDTETRMDLRQQRVNGAMTYSFQSKGHKCRFIAKIPALVSMRKYILHGATQAQHGEESDTDVSDREYDHFGFDPSPSSSQTSQASLASTKSADDVASYLKDISPSPSLTRSLPRPSFGTRTPKSFFSKEIADMRAKPGDLDSILFCCF
ncbi:hypothetical protein FPV67DRAFT_509714 [Lyophyllum atratum]|nr:hypothetical protein FPV67DRAFT_509714 [Lyophyllum atratum]